MKGMGVAVAVAIACVLVGGCRLPRLGKPKPPVGQVAATVDGREITVRDIDVELAGLNTDPKARKAAEQAALKVIITRRLLADAARAQGLDKSPDFAVQRQRTEDGLLAEALANKVAAGVPAPTREEAEALVTTHPDSFAERKVFNVDQLRTVRPLDDATLNKLKALNTLEEAEALLIQSHIDYRRNVTNIDALALNPKAVDFIVKLPPGAIFEIPEGAGATVNQIRSVKVQPLAGEAAVNAATQWLKGEHGREAAARELNAVIVKGAGSVQYNRAFAPPPPAKAQPTPKSTAAAGASAQG